MSDKQKGLYSLNKEIEKEIPEFVKRLDCKLQLLNSSLQAISQKDFGEIRKLNKEKKATEELKKEIANYLKETFVL